MARATVPVALQERLGDEGSLALAELLDSEKAAWSEDVLSLAGERFERRVADGASVLRVEFRDGFAAQRIEFRDGLAAHHIEFRDGLAAQRSEFHDSLAAQRSEFRDSLAAQRSEFRDSLTAQRIELREGLAALRVEFHDGFAALRHEIANVRVDLFKWSFMFWVGQVAAIALLLGYMLRGVRP